MGHFIWNLGILFLNLRRILCFVSIIWLKIIESKCSVLDFPSIVITMAAELLEVTKVSKLVSRICVGFAHRYFFKLWEGVVTFHKVLTSYDLCYRIGAFLLQVLKWSIINSQSIIIDSFLFPENSKAMSINIVIEIKIEIQNTEFINIVLLLWINWNMVQWYNPFARKSRACQLECVIFWTYTETPSESLLRTKSIYMYSLTVFPQSSTFELKAITCLSILYQNFYYNLGL